MQKESGREVIRPLTGIRGVTIALVVATHFWKPIVIFVPWLASVMEVVRQMSFRMDIIFMLSGFVISYVYISMTRKLSAKGYRDFLLGRVARLYPSYLVAMAITVTGVAVCRYKDIPVEFDCPISALPVKLFLLQAWPSMEWALMTWNYPTWFLSALAFGYIVVFPFCWVLVHRLRESRFTVLLWVLVPPLLWRVLRFTESLGEFYHVIQVSCDFISGCALMVLFRQGGRFVALAQKHLDKTTIVLVLLTILSVKVPKELFDNVVDVIVVMLPLFLAGLTAERSLLARLMATRPMVWLGGVSFALFLTHAWVLKFFKLVLPAANYADSSVLVRYSILAAYVAGMMVVALMMYQLVELPCANALKKVFLPRKADKQTAGKPADTREGLPVTKPYASCDSLAPGKSQGS